MYICVQQKIIYEIFKTRVDSDLIYGLDKNMIIQYVKWYDEYTLEGLTLPYSQYSKTSVS